MHAPRGTDGERWVAQLLCLFRYHNRFGLEKQCAYVGWFEAEQDLEEEELMRLRKLRA